MRHLPHIALLTLIIISFSGLSSIADEPVSAVPINGSDIIHDNNSKIDSRLKSVDAANIIENSPLVRVQDGFVQVYVHCNRVNEDDLFVLESLGLKTEIVNEDLRIVQGWISQDNLEELENLEFIKNVTPPVYGYTKVGDVTSEGDSILNADEAREMFGVDGSGVRLGVISDGVDGLSFSQLTGDLPSNVEVIDGGSGSEGRAMLEITHDLAPGAQLVFTSGFPTSLDFINAIDELTNAGVDIIVDDLGFLGEPYFEDGPVADAAANAVNQGIIFISAAGNDANRHYQAPFVGVASEEGYVLQDFGAAAGEASDTKMRVTISSGSSVFIFLQWTDPFGLSNTDFDLIARDPITGEIIDIGDNIQDGDDDPIEIVGLMNPSGSNAIFDLEIDLKNGQSASSNFPNAGSRANGVNELVEIYFNTLSGFVVDVEHNVPKDSIFGHPAAEGVLAVGAVFGSTTVEFFSSQGPVTIQTSNNSEGLDTIERDAPAFVASDGVSTTVPGFDPFFGTSASAPHAAAIAALVLQAENASQSQASINPSALTRQVETVTNILTGTAVDLSPPGFDFISGFGRLDALAAVSSILSGPINPPPPDPTPNPPPSTGNTNTSTGGCSMAQSNHSNTNGLLNIALILTTIGIVMCSRRRLISGRKEDRV